MEVVFRFALSEPPSVTGPVVKPKACRRAVDAVPFTNGAAKIAEAPAPLVRVWTSEKLPLNRLPAPIVTPLII